MILRTILFVDDFQQNFNDETALQYYRYIYTTNPLTSLATCWKALSVRQLVGCHSSRNQIRAAGSAVTITKGKANTVNGGTLHVGTSNVLRDVRSDDILVWAISMEHDIGPPSLLHPSAVTDL